ncbi:MAG: hypothetical protein LJE69_05490 [Thiohalocapsa sp.]|uniref:hypothetical protein n=1 Tax=Thiohalocapsa sp. TaxID=2497641 RepID=UPI0025D825C1|nr:hypothetical protein [Thiohalocapsa sp.]MCG6940686.1 hypothetical protein [Thiohalocapsa sp.]
MTKLQNTLNRVLTAGAAAVLSLAIAAPAQAMTPAELDALKQDTVSLEDRTFTPSFSAQAAFADSASIASAILSLETNLSFPVAGLTESAQDQDFSTQALLSKAYTTRDTMLLRACTIAENAVPPGPRAYNDEEMAARINTISNALRLVAPMYIPTRTDLRNDPYGSIEQANADVEDIMDLLGDYVALDTERDMSSQYYDYLLTVIWQNASDACDNYSY